MGNPQELIEQYRQPDLQELFISLISREGVDA
jgi:hypothetical protein